MGRHVDREELEDNCFKVADCEQNKRHEETDDVNQNEANKPFYYSY